MKALLIWMSFNLKDPEAAGQLLRVAPEWARIIMARDTCGPAQLEELNALAAKASSAV